MNYTRRLLKIRPAVLSANYKDMVMRWRPERWAWESESLWRLRPGSSSESLQFSVVTFFKKLIWAWSSSKSEEVATVSLFRESTTDPELASIMGWLTLSSVEAKKRKVRITSYNGMVNGLLGRCATKALLARIDELSHSFKQDMPRLWDFFQKVWDLTSRCDGVYNENTLRRFLLEGIGLCICSNNRSW